MTDYYELNKLLVPTDLSESSRATFDRAVAMATGENATIFVLHVIDPMLAEFVISHDFASREEAMDAMHSQAITAMHDYTVPANSPVKVVSMATEGQPFLKIIDKARDLCVDAVVIGKVGARPQIEMMLFGSTAEKVVRGCTRPVLVLPSDE